MKSKPRCPTCGRTMPGKHKTIDPAKLAKMLAKEMSVAEIAKEFGVSRMAVYKAMKK